MTQPPKTRVAPPRASALAEALRGLGYSTSTAIADIVDNSIAAQATVVALTFHWGREKSRISIHDDGIGMTDGELERAMRLGDKNPNDKRAKQDLGRFGLGLKTASFSQCKSLTVGSVRERRSSCLRWDLDVLSSSENDDWLLIEVPPKDSAEVLEPIAGSPSGTIVVWDKLDRIVTPGFTEQDFLDLTDHVEAHLAMVFHRYLAGPSAMVQITLNGRAIQPWDPFLAAHPATWSSPTQRLATASGVVEIQCHVLPHNDRLDHSQNEGAAGPDGWTTQQGFYVYRNERLLVAGSWLGLGESRPWVKDESHRLARIRLDIPNSADAEWKIDIRKSNASPPISIRRRLVQLAADTRRRARKVLAHRGQTFRQVGGQSPALAWRSEHFAGGMRYRIDEAHPAVQAVLDEAGPLEPSVRAMLRVIEETIPVQRIWLDNTKSTAIPPTALGGEPPAEVRVVLEAMYRNLVARKGHSSTRAKEVLLGTEPFQNFPELVRALPDIDGEGV